MNKIVRYFLNKQTLNIKSLTNKSFYPITSFFCRKPIKTLKCNIISYKSSLLYCSLNTSISTKTNTDNNSKNNSFSNEDLKRAINNFDQLTISGYINILQSIYGQHPTNFDIDDYQKIYDLVYQQIINKDLYYLTADNIMNLALFFAPRIAEYPKLPEAFIKRFNELVDISSPKALTKLNQIYFGQFLFSSTSSVHIEGPFWTHINNYLLDYIGEIPSNALPYFAMAYVKNFTRSIKIEPGLVDNLNKDFVNKHKFENDHITKLFLKTLRNNLTQYDGQSLYMVAWTYAFVENKEDFFWEAVEERFKQLLPTLSPVQFANIAHAISLASKGSEDLWDSLGLHVMKNLKDFNQTSIGMLIMAFSNVEYISLRLWETLQNYVKKNIDIFYLNDLILVVIGFGRHRTIKSGLWDLLQKRIINDFDKLSLENVISVIQSFGGHNKGNNQLWDLIKKKVIASEGQLTHNQKIMLYLIMKQSNKLNKELDLLFEDCKYIDKILKNNKRKSDEKNDSQDFQNVAYESNRKTYSKRK